MRGGTNKSTELIGKKKETVSKPGARKRKQKT